MNITQAIEIAKDFIDDQVTKLQVKRSLFDQETGRKLYNKAIREEVVAEKYGVYIWVNNATQEIIYVGRAGTIKTDGRISDHCIQDRLTASRSKDKITKKDIQTNDYIKSLMIDHNIEAIDFYILHARENEPPAYIEALILYRYYKANGRLPQFNSSF